LVERDLFVLNEIEKFGSGALAPPFSEAEAITSDKIKKEKK